MMESATVLGAGSWGTALAAMLAARGLRVQFYGRDEALMAEMAVTRRNGRYLTDVEIPAEVEPVSSLQALRPAPLVVFVTPSKSMAALAAEMGSLGLVDESTVLLSCSKGVELGTGRCMTEILHGVFPQVTVAALSGPNHAEEIARRMPSAAVVGCLDEGMAIRLQQTFSLPWFRCYTSTDVLGVEWAGAMKNPYAIAAGIAKGLGLGDNAIAALVTRALAEMVRLGVASGGRTETFYGLSGVGDLVATCYSEHSRNHRVGLMLGQGRSLSDIMGGMRMVAEGVPNTESLWLCARGRGVRTPLLDEVHAVLYEQKSPREALRELFSRDPRPEVD
ncbi:NAD(P)-dependent glycerol-3-phosphate dehydrogenase [Phragmitibacter flavus]|uniref:Glycerol-3-phosphate dehydrogenase [NAD(P)+] n=1 Tax=Phragmitibacter flavus TaxID=2576071 RepID=A0A5R8KCP7_9BACT|nr:NAD(P)H-dependent glycerol-3-phosphate dehydrogenase [Phragmitibacter flavus]TLD69715.1 NAD(P)-dependent glycerol-3-phosphate dehydrogenase [Phragmitibacter flavus]